MLRFMGSQRVGQDGATELNRLNSLVNMKIRSNSGLLAFVIPAIFLCVFQVEL